MSRKMGLALLTAGLLSTAAHPALPAGWEESPLGRATFGKLWSGQPFETAELAGKVVLVKFWADW